jgi:hypothetical protein
MIIYTSQIISPDLSGGALVWGMEMDLVYDAEPMVFYFVDKKSSSNNDSTLYYNAEPFVTFKAE